MTKNSFENELMLGMQREMQPYLKKQGMNSLVKAADYLSAASEILEEAGLSAQADQVLRILGKIALADEAAAKDSPEFYEKMLKWMEEPSAPIDPENPQAGEELSFTSLKDPEELKEIEFNSLLNKRKELPSSADLSFESIAGELGLSSEQMVKNLAEHGTMLVDDSDADDLLNVEIDEKPLQVSENDLEKTFEDAD